MHGQNGATGQQAEKEKSQLPQLQLQIQQRHACPISQSPRSIPLESSSRKSYTTKDGRKIDVGDCALFQAGNAPPFIGILRRVIVDKESGGAVRLTVNWLYRPADIKLVKGIPFEAAPNEIFYSFHKDDTPAASLLHPCKVAFLRKGADLPSGVSAFVCRRVYDTSHRRLWWLTDRDYTDEHQEEVDQLLNRTRLEMQAAVQQGARSPRALPHSDPVQAKSKKRDRGSGDSAHEQQAPSSKRAKADDSESSFVKVDRVSPSSRPEEIAGIVDKDGGLCSLPGVEKLVSLMQQDRSDGSRKPIEVASRRIMLAGVVAATDKQECRDRLVQLGGLAVLDDWLQEAHKGKSGDGGNPGEVDKVLEELLLTLLRALQKLPVDLDALKTCVVGKSVNNLKNHKNVEIQKKARKLVETWKKRVDAEMKQSGEKPGTPGKQASSGGDPLQAISTTTKDAKSSTKAGQAAGDAPAKSVGSATSKSGTTASSKENSPNNSGSNEIQGASVKEEKSSTWSSAPVTSACKEEKVSKAKMGEKENKWSRVNVNISSERPGCEKSLPAEGEPPQQQQQRLILRFPNPVKSPAREGGAKVSSPKVLDRSSSSGLGEAAAAVAGQVRGNNSNNKSESSSEKRHKGGEKSGEKGGPEARVNGKVAEKATREQAASGNVVNGGMSLLATVAADEMMKCDGNGSCNTVSTSRSVVTEEAEHGNSAEQGPSAEQRGAAPEGKVSAPEDVKEDGGSEPPPPPEAPARADEKLEQTEAEMRKTSPETRSPQEEDALEVARQVAKEVEEEVEGKSTCGADAEEKIQSPAEEPPPPAPSAAQAPADAPTGDEDENLAKTPATPEQSPPPAPVQEEAAPLVEASRPMFDLNEGFAAEESPETITTTSPVTTTMNTTSSTSGQVFVAPAASLPPVSSLSAPIPVMASTNTSFIPPPAPASSMRPNKEVGWRGAAATSAFRPAEPRAPAAAAQEKKGKPAFDFDLNLADGDAEAEATTTTASTTPGVARSFLSGFPSTSGMGERNSLDLNEVNNLNSSHSRRNSDDDGGSLRLRPPGGGLGGLRNFDLNDGPSTVEDAGGGGGVVGGGEDFFLRSLSSKPKSSNNNNSTSGSSNPVFSGASLHAGGELLNLSSWYNPGSTYPPVGIQGFSSAGPPRTEQPPPAAPSPAPAPAPAPAAAYSHPFVNGAASFASDLYRGGVPAGGSSASLGYHHHHPAAAAAAANPQSLYSYPGFPFSSGFPFTSAGGSSFVAQSPYVGSSLPGSFSTMSSQVVGRPPYFIPENASSGIPEAGVVGWGRRSLDLNTGPEASAAAIAAAHHQQQAAIAAAAAAAAAIENSGAGGGDHHQIRQQQQQQYSLGDPMQAALHQHQMGGSSAGSLKRKEPDTGWDVYRSVYRR